MWNLIAGNDNKGNDEILMSVRFQDLESGINYFRYMWIQMCIRDRHISVIQKVNININLMV